MQQKTKEKGLTAQSYRFCNSGHTFKEVLICLVNSQKIHEKSVSLINRIV